MYIIHAGYFTVSVVFQQNIYIHRVFLLRQFFKPTPPIDHIPHKNKRRFFTNELIFTKSVKCKLYLLILLLTSGSFFVIRHISKKAVALYTTESFV